MYHDPPASRLMYVQAAAIATLLFLLLFQGLGLYKRPQLGRFPERIPRLVRAIGWGLLLSLVAAELVRTTPPFSRVFEALFPLTVLVLVLLERLLLFKLELRLARRMAHSNSVIILGTDPTARRLQEALEGEPRLRSRVVAFMRVRPGDPADGIDPALVHGNLNALPGLMERERVDRVVLTDNSLAQEKLVEIVLQCERAMVRFNLVPDLFRLLTSEVEVQTVEGIPMLGVRDWPLDRFVNRCVKRMEDIAGSLLGLLLGIPVLALCALAIKLDSAGPVFFRQERCGERGRAFHLYKLRTMRLDAEQRSGPVWTTEDDPRRTRVGSFLRRWNLDEWPQFWNVLCGDMSLVGPRPERPHFVEQFKEDISRYMWRHASKPGITGWAQVNGLRGNTSITDRIRYDLFYLENWSLALDFKILARTLFSRENAY